MHETNNIDSNTLPGSVPEHERGVTLLEIIVVVVVIGILLTVLAPRVFGTSEKLEASACKTLIDGVAGKFEEYRQFNRVYPSTSEGIGLLMNPPSGSPYLESIPKDPWDTELKYVYPANRSKRAFNLYSAGPDRTFETADDIGNWPKSDS